MVEKAYIEHQRAVYAVALRIVHDHHEAEDIVQTTFLKAWMLQDKLVDDGRGLLPWLVTTARNAAIDHIRKRVPTPVEELWSGALVEDAAKLWRVLLTAMALIPEPQRTMVFLRHFLGVTPAFAADHFERSVASVNGLINRGTAQLRAELRRDGDPRA